MPSTALCTQDLKLLTGSLKSLVQSDHPVLTTVAEYLLSGSEVLHAPQVTRPLPHRLRAEQKGPTSHCPAHVTGLCKWRRAESRAAAAGRDHRGHKPSVPHCRAQPSLFQMYHTASLLHDDIVDTDSAAGCSAAHVNFGD